MEVCNILCFLLTALATIVKGNTSNSFRQALKYFEPHSCTILITENKEQDLPTNLNSPIIIQSLSNLKRKDEVFFKCGKIIANLDNYEEQDSKEMLAKLPAVHDFVFTSSNLDHVNKFPKLARLPLALYFLETAIQTVKVMSRPNIFEERSFANVAVLNVNDDPLSKISPPKVVLDYHGNSFKAVAFNYKPYSMPNYKDPSKHAGYEFEITKALAEALNMKLTVAPPSSGFMWGRFDKQTGNFSGLVGDLQHAVAEVGWANLFITPDRAQVMDYSDWYLMDSSSFLVKRAKPYHGVYSLIFPLESKTWFAILAVFVTYIVYYYFFAKYSPVKNTFSYADLISFGCSVIFEASHAYSHNKTSVDFRLGNVGLILGMFILSSGYSGALISFFSVDVYPKNPETFEDLAKMVHDEDTTVRICCHNIWLAMEESSLESFQLLSQPERRMLNDFRQIKEGFIGTHKNGDIFALAKNNMEIQRRLHNAVVPYNELFAMKEGFLPIQIALGLSFNSPFKISVNYRLAQLKGAGIVDKLVRKGHEIAGAATHADVADVDSEGEIKFSNGIHYRRLNLIKVQGLFQLHLCICGLALLVFFMEWVRKRFMRQPQAIE